ncbi:Copper-transporting P-type ATPase, partial [Cercospora beticola]
MDGLKPAPVIRCISIVNHIVTVDHSCQILVTTIRDLLRSNGYDVFGIILDSASNEHIHKPSQLGISLAQAVQQWDPERKEEVHDNTRLMHLANCQMCAAHQGSVKWKNSSLSVVVSGSEDAPKDFSALISIDGMTCSACVSTVTNALQAIPAVRRADVSLVSRSATVSFRSNEAETTTKELLGALEDAGYDVQLVELKAIEQRTVKAVASDSESATVRTVNLEVYGMHCPQCPERVLQTMSGLGVDIKKPPTLEEPFITISYIPDVPRLSIRRIIRELNALDRSFVVSIHKPITIEERSRQMLRRDRRAITMRAILAGIIAIPSLVIGVVYMNFQNGLPSSWQLHPVYFFAADYFHEKTLKDLWALWRPGSPVPIGRRFYRFGNMNMLISLGTTIAYFASVGQLIVSAVRDVPSLEGASRQSYFDSVVFLTFFLLLGRLAEATMKAKAGDAVSALGNLRPTTASLVVQDDKDDVPTTETVDVDFIDTGDVIRIPNGASPPCDGALLNELAGMDESSLTGESRLVKKQQGDIIFSGTINKGSPLAIKVTNPIGSSILDSLIQVVREGQGKRAPVERVADLLTAYFVPVITAIAILTWVIWLTLGLSGALPDDYLDVDIGGWPFWSLQFAIAVFIIACPCGLGLAAPTALFVGGGLAAKHGILVKGGGEAFQEASNLDVVVFDKTGTLTLGIEPKIVECEVFEDACGLDRATVLGMLGCMEENSSHPLARAAVEFVNSNQAVAVEALEIEEVGGRGLKGLMRAARDEDAPMEILVGNEVFLEDHSVPITSTISTTLHSWKSQGNSILLFACRPATKQWNLAGIFAASDPPRPEAAQVIKSLQTKGIDVWMLSGDNPSTAATIGQKVGISPSNIIAGVLPTEKADKIKYLQRALRPKYRRGLQRILGKKHNQVTIAMVGDGINDAPALSAADVGIAVASGSDVAIQSASFILMQSDLRAVLTLVSLSRAVFRRVIMNFCWAAVYNLIALPVAAGVLYPVRTSSGDHVRLDPAWAALAMAGS